MSLHPLRVWAAAMVGLTVATAPVASIAARGQAPLPTGRQVVDHYVEAMGGREAFARVTSVTARGQFDLPDQNISGPVEIFTARPDKQLVRVEITGVGHVENGYDGKVGWMIDPQSGPAVLQGEELSELAEDSWFDAPLHAPDRVRELTTVEQADFDQHKAYKLHVVYKSGLDETEYYDVDSGLFLGWEGKRMTPMGLLPAEAYFREYKACGPIKEPTTLVQRALGSEQRITIASCEINTVPADTFALPPSIKALIK